MTSERKKAILTLSATLIIGILLGLLLPGFFHKMNDRGHMRRGGGPPDPQHKKEWFVGTIHRIVQPDSAQAKQIKPITDWAAAKIDAAEKASNQRLADIMDSVKLQLKPIISEEQFKRLSEFDAKARGHWRGGER